MRGADGAWRAVRLALYAPRITTLRNLERHPTVIGKNPLTRVAEDVGVTALEDDAEATEREIVSQPSVEAEVPVAIRVADEGVRTSFDP